MLNIFDSKEKKVRLSHVKNLITLAMVDGEFSQEEKELIISIGYKAGLSVKDMERIVNDPASISFHIPDSYKEKIEQLYDLASLAVCDGKIDEAEIAFCETVARKMNLSDMIVLETFAKMSNLLIEKVARDIAINKLLKK